jgi:tryptophan-rich sensory protein
MEHPGPTPRPAIGTTDIAVLILFIALCAGIAALGGWATSISVGTWYQTLEKASFNPPNWIFGPVWTVLYGMIAVAGWLVWRKAGWKPLFLKPGYYGIQLVLNFGWSATFFAAQAIGPSVLIINLLLVVIALTTYQFLEIDKRAGYLFMPYLAWVTFATILNVQIWKLN